MKDEVSSDAINLLSTLTDDCFINTLTEDLISHTLSFTSPRDACRLSLVAKFLKSAADSDAVWEKFLPNDYQEIISRSHDHAQLPPVFPSKKELYLHLSDHPIIMDGGTKSFSLEKYSGKKCYMLAARDLSITWGDTPQYWRWVAFPDSRFPEVAELLSVCWFKICGKLNTHTLSPDTIYAAYFVFKSTSEFYGFEYKRVEVSLGVTGCQTEIGTVYLDPSFRRRGREGKYPMERVDGWLEVELGEYFNIGGEDAELEMNAMEIKELNWKSGLIVQGIEIRPKGAK